MHAGIAVVRVLRARKFQIADFTGASDPYVLLVYAKQTAKTKVVRRTLNPIWNETLQLNVDDLSEPILLYVKDKDRIGADDPLGDARIALDRLRAGEPAQLALPLEHVGTGVIEVEVTFFPLVA